jgi:hypothetical protein
MSDTYPMPTVYIYDNGEAIKAVYMIEAHYYHSQPEWNHIATLNPAMWIESVLSKNRNLLEDAK